MGNLFNMDNKFFTFMSKVADLMILNFLCFLCCIPIITIGPSVTALNYVTLKMARNEESYIVKSFFRSFKQNLKQGIIIGLLAILVGAILIADLLILKVIDISYSDVIRVVILAMMMIYFIVMLYIFPVLSKFENTIKQTIKNSFIMSIRHFPSTILIILCTIAPFVIVYVVTSYGLLFYILLGFSLPAFANSFLFNKIFEKYIPTEEDAPTPEEVAESNGADIMDQYYIPKVDPNEPTSPESPSESKQTTH